MNGRQASPPPGRVGRAEAWRRFDYRAVGTALVIGAAGGAFFAWLELPLAWMIGAIAATCAAAVAQVPVKIPPAMRSSMVVLLGVLLGSTFKPDILDQVGDWILTLSSLVVYILASLVIGGLYLRRVAGYDGVTAYFTAAPGGLVEMVTAGRALGGDDRIIALSHSARIMFTVFAIPVGFAIAGNQQEVGARSLGPSFAALSVTDYLMLAGCIVGAPIAKMLRVPAAALVGPMVLSAAIHLAGLTAGTPPAVLIAVAQVVVGSAIGVRFSGATIGSLARMLVVAAGLTVILLALDLLFAIVLSAFTDIGFIDLLLAFAPGGTIEMSLVALALGVDTAFVATHHVFRILMVVVMAPLLFPLMRRWMRPSGG